MSISLEEELKSIKKRLELAHEAGRVGTFEWDLITKEYIVSPELEKLYGLPKGGFDTLQPDWSQAIHPGDREEARKAVGAALKGESPGLANEFRVIWPDGSIHWLHSRAQMIKNEKGELVKMYGVNVDITPQKEAEQKAINESRKFLTLIENSSSGILLLDIKGNVKLVGHSVLGYTYEDRVGRNVLESIHPDDRPRVISELQFLATTPGGSRISEYRALHKNGSWRWIESVSSNLMQDPNIQSIVVNYRDITERKEAEKIIREQAIRDPLTGTLNRKTFQEMLQAHISTPKRYGVSVLFFDLDRFKNVNDTLGHEIGDKVLVRFADMLAEHVGANGAVGRLGGDEFAVLFSNARSKDDVQKLAKKIMRSFKDPIIIEGRPLFIEASIGITTHPKDGNDAVDLLRNADIALYRAKDEGRNNYQFYSEDMKMHAAKRMLLEQRMREAPQNRELFLEYQPIIDLKTDKVVNLEALMRWNHPKLGIMYPNQFIPLAEETGFIKILGRWALDEIILQHQNWQSKKLSAPKITVNVSGLEFADVNLTKKIYTILKKSKLDPNFIEFEITETTAMRDLNRTLEKLKAFSQMGIGIIMDDFGTGYSSLGYLRRFPLKKIKIDKSFIKNCTASEQDGEIVRAIISMAHSLNLQVVAEGVETQEQLDFVRSYGCDFAQGFLLGKPQRAEKVEMLFQPVIN